MPQTLIETSKLRTNPNNPRAIREDQLDKLVKSLREFPEMLEARPIVTNPDLVVLGGNMRLKAALLAGLEKVPVYVATWEEAKKKEFVIKDNVAFGEWDWDMLANEWEAEDLDKWGLCVPFETEEKEQPKEPKLCKHCDRMIP
jgi:ParB-like chromosome segregation protein Spo0J